MRINNNKVLFFSGLLITLVLSTSLFMSCGPDKESTKRKYNKALEEFYSGKYKEAIAIFDDLIKDDPDNSELFFYRGSSWFNFHNTDKALQDFNQAILLNPNYADAYSTRGDIYSFLGKKDEACKDYKQAGKLGKPNMRDKVRYCP